MATACKIDFDEQADEWLKEVQPNAKKLAEHQRKKDRKDAEKALNEKKERIRKAKEAREAAAKEAAENPQVRLFFGILLKLILYSSFKERYQHYYNVFTMLFYYLLKPIKYINKKTPKIGICKNYQFLYI